MTRSRLPALPAALRASLAACALAVSAGLPGTAAAQSTTPAPCPGSMDVGQAHMLGLWRAEFEEGLPGATLLLEKHPRYADSLSGAINRNGERAQVAGDVEDGGLVLEESRDGQRIAATWIGDFVEGACGREVRGTWQATGDDRARRFVLRKQ